MPAPGPEETAHSARLVQHIREVIEESSGVIEFSRFMDLALYSHDGYYTSGLRKFGEHGDFITAPELGTAFASCVGCQISQILDQSDTAEVLEFGAGSGLLAAQLLCALAERGALPDRYCILELSAELKKRQFELLKRRAPQHLPRVSWLNELPETLSGAILANEVVDAMPVDRFRVRGGELRGVGVTWRDRWFADADYAVNGPQWDPIRRLGLAEGYTSEAGFQGQAWIRTLATRLRRGCILVIDYGFPEHEYFHPQRSGGTLMCHYRHRAHPDPYVNVGLQDITAHVDFTALARCARETGLSLLGFTTQASFLLSTGLLDAAQAARRGSTVDLIEVNQQIKKLTLPSEMGELFKVLAVGSGLQRPLLGFSHADHRGRL